MSAGHTPPQRLVERYRSEIFSYLMRILQHRADAEDVCQEVLMRAYREVSGLRPDTNLRAWLYRVATNMAFNALRQRKRRWAHEAREEGRSKIRWSPSPYLRVQLRELVQAVDRLPRRQRAALIQRHFQGLAYRDIAASLGCTEAAARANVYQAVKRLRDAVVDES